MKFGSTKAVSLAATAIAAVLATPAVAQTQPQTGNTEAGAGDIIVTARRVEERLQDVPISITVFSQEQLSARNVASATDLAAYTPSLSLNSRYGPDKSSFAIRGFSQDLNTLPSVGVYFAEAVAPRLNSNITSGNGAGPGAMFDLQNVQVLKGPQGTLFGRNTTGGAILIVPHKPTDRFEGYVEGTYGNYDAKRVQAVINIPLADSFKVRLGVDRYKRDGYLNNRSGVGPKDFNNINYIAARLSILADLTPDLENYTIATYSHSNTHGMIPKLAFCDPTSTALLKTAMCNEIAAEQAAGYGYYDVSNSVADPYVRNTTWQVINTTTWRASDTVTVKNIASYGQASEAYQFSLGGDNIAPPFVIVHPGPNRRQGDQYTFTEELRLEGRTADSRLTWQAGGYLERSQPTRGVKGQEQYTQILSTCTDVYTFQCNPFVGTIPAGQIGIARNVYYYRNNGLYAQATYKLTDQLSVTGGIRYTWDWQKEVSDNVKIQPFPASLGGTRYTCSRAVTPSPNPGAVMTIGGYCTRIFSTKSQKPTWLIDVDYKPVQDLLVYAKFARGYRGGGINEANVGAEKWNPEYVDNYEVGVKTSFHGAVSGTFNVNGFLNNFSDQQVSVFIPQCTIVVPGCTNPAPTGINGIANVGKSRIKGVEVDGSLNFGNLRFDFGYAYLDTKIIAATASFCDNTRFICSAAVYPAIGSALVYSPKNRITVSASYALPLPSSVGKVSFGATFTHTDSQFSSHSDDAAFAAGKIPYNASIAPATNLLNLNVDWKSVAGSPIDLALFASNVTKQKFYVAAGNGLASSGGDSLIVGEPRIYGVRLKFRFGS